MPCSPRDAKRQGELAELVFLHRASAQGFTVSKPYGETAAYDFIVDAAGFISRVQVRSVSHMWGGAYRVSAANGGGQKHALTANDIDVLAAYVVPCDAWYLIPVQAFAPVKNLDLYPHRCSPHKYEPFREAWQVLAGCRQRAQSPSESRRDEPLVTQHGSAGNRRGNDQSPVRDGTG